jgi:hypothetical protein
MNSFFGWKEIAAPVLSLFTSAATLVCCALPALLVSLGMGAVLAGLVSDFPQLVWLSRHKAAVFGAAALLLLAAGMMLWRARSFPCPADPAQARACRILRRTSLFIYGLSVLLFLTGAFFAFLAPLVMEK